MGALWRVIWRRHWHVMVYWSAVTSVLAVLIGVAVAVDVPGVTFLMIVALVIGGGFSVAAAMDGGIGKFREWAESILQEALDE